jgi:peptidoglycan/xylan/chitin deacetylase (PgdA/CDA1 family)
MNLFSALRAAFPADLEAVAVETDTGLAYSWRDLERGTAMIERASGVHPTLFRAPHGFRAPWVTAIARSLGQRTVGWSLGVWDSDRPGVEVIAERTVAGARPGAILLLHDGDGYDPSGDRVQTARAVPLIVDRLLAQNYRFDLLDAA